jgi:hypothetical protein
VNYLYPFSLGTFTCCRKIFRSPQLKTYSGRTGMTQLCFQSYELCMLRPPRHNFPRTIILKHENEMATMNVLCGSILRAWSGLETRGLSLGWPSPRPGHGQGQAFCVVLSAAGCIYVQGQVAVVMRKCYRRACWRQLVKLAVRHTIYTKRI